MSTRATDHPKSPYGQLLPTWSGSGPLARHTFKRGGRQWLRWRRVLGKSSPVFLSLPPWCETPRHGTELWWHRFVNQVFVFFFTSSQLAITLCTPFVFISQEHRIVVVAYCRRLLSCFEIVGGSHGSSPLIPLFTPIAHVSWAPSARDAVRLRLALGE